MERPISPRALAQVQAALFDGRKIEAIRIYREDTGSSLTDTKSAVDNLEAELRVSSPEKFQAPPRSKGKGCGGCLTVMIVLGALALVLLLLLVRSK